MSKFDQALSHHQAGRLDEAERLYREALDNEPANTQIHNNLAIALSEQGKTEAAMVCFRQALDLHSDFAEAHFGLGVLLQGHGDTDEAIQSFRRAIDIDPDFFAAHVNLGVAFHDQGLWRDAAVCYGRALQLNPDFAEAHLNLGLVLEKQNKLSAAVASFERALELNPDYAEAFNGLAVTLQNQGKSEAAMASFRQAIEANPGFAEAHNNLGNLYRENDQLDKAKHLFQDALKLRPDYAEAHNNLGKTLKSKNKLEAAMASYQEAIRINPQFSEPYGGLGLVLNGLGKFEESLAQFNIKLAYDRGENPIDPNHASFRFITKPKIDHDIEQFRYLASLGSEPERFLRLAETYETVRDEIDWSAGSGWLVPLSDDHRGRIGETYNRAHHVIDAPEIPGSAINPDIDAAAVTADYFNNAPGMTFMDGLLTPGALAALRRYLLESTIWFDMEHTGGYLGTYLNDGLACPLVLQIAEELRLTFPEIFKDFRLNQLWAYKYDSRLEGIPMHADFAAVNINFWITPDDANRNPKNGGLVVYDTEAPQDWSFKSYNNDTARMEKFLADNNSGKMVVPHAQNRVVMFNSDLFHQTDTIDFKPGYQNRRLNITLLFGQRSG